MTNNRLPIGSRWDEWGARDRVTVKPGGFHVYVAWGVDRGRPLYIGKSAALWARIGAHSRVAKWAAQVVEWEAYSFDSEQDALDIEAEAITALNPIYNAVRPETSADREARRVGYERREAAKQARHDRWAVEDEAKEARKAARAERAEENARLFRQRLEAKKRPARPQSPWIRGRVRPAPDYPDFFTSEQFEIISRVQNRGLR